MRVALRTDASGRIGTGHLRRCLSLARALNDEGVETLFVCRAHDAVSIGVDLAAQPVAWLPAPTAPQASETDEPSHAAWAGVSWRQDAAETQQALASFAPDWVVVDHYAFDARWQQSLARASGARIAAIDDLADREHAAELLVDHNLHAEPQRKYAGRIPSSTRLLLGPRYALLAKEYATTPRYRFRRKVGSIGIFLSGADAAADATRTALLACREVAGFAGEIEIVTNSRSPHLAGLRALAARSPGTRVLTDLPDLRRFFARHDLQLGSGGGAAWERCCLGAPTIAVQIAANQAAVLPHLSALGALEWVRDADPQQLGAAVLRLLTHPRQRLALARAARGLVDGLGSARVAAVLALAMQPALELRAAGPADEALLLAWANDPQARAVGFHPDRILPRQHHAWLATRLARPDDCLLLVAQSRAGTPVGTVRFERADGHWTISYSLDPAFRGWGHGGRLLGGALVVLRQRFGPVAVEGWVRGDNAASLRVFRALGFRESRVDRGGELCHLFQQHP